MSLDDVQGPGPETPVSRFRIAGVRLAFVASAYAPLAAVIGASTLSACSVLALAWFAFAIVLAGSVAFLTYVPSRTIGSHPFTYSDREDLGEASAGYLAGYLLPFLALPSADFGTALGYAIFFGLIFLLHLRSNLGLINPTLFILGWRVSRVTVKGVRVFYIHRKDIGIDGSGQAVEFNFIYIERIIK